MSASVRSPGRFTAMPSAIVSPASNTTGWPASSDAGNAAHASTCTPITSTDGRADFTAIATPLTSPPPPTGTMIRARSSTSSSSSSPSVPWPATTSGSSNGCTKAMPACSARRAAAATQSSTDPSSCTITAPSAAAPSTLEIGASRGMWTSQGTPRTRAANASACAWLPALPATTPSAACGPSAASLLSAPRILNEPVRCSASALTRTSPPARSLSVSDGRTGVWRATSRTASRAAATSSAETERGHAPTEPRRRPRSPRARPAGATRRRTRSARARHLRRRTPRTPR